jgi:hypothetical protein
MGERPRSLSSGICSSPWSMTKVIHILC